MAVATPPVEFESPTEYRHEITAHADRVRFVAIPPRRYLMVDGTDAPGGPGFRGAIGSLYPIAYTLHFALKRRGIQAPIGGLEGLWWIGQPGPINTEQFRASPQERGAWNWRLMLPVPDEASDDDVSAAVDQVRATKASPLLDAVRCETWEEGPAAQILHLGPYAEEPATIDRLHGAIAKHGLRPRGCHHEVYISDPNRTSPERLKTLLRQPVEGIAR